ncbi:MAG: DNA primase [Nitrospirota bacterium]|nr:DNA primase [Nitrospirota bacterium]MDH5296832.1 DNA primase [Nitrospirota bacterium]
MGGEMTGEKRGVPPEILQQIRDRVDIIDLISTYVSLSKAGQNYKGLCPFHSEKTPSFSVNPVRQMFYCFGCSVGGDAFTFLMKQEGMDFMEALRELSQRTGVVLPERRELAAKTTSGLSRERYYHLYQLAASWYHRNLQEAPEGQVARDYLDQRGITRESWSTFQLGYAPDGWNGLSKWLERQSVRPEELIQAGLVVQKEKEDGSRVSTYDRFRARVMFPIADPRGQVLGFGGRIMQDGASPKYLNSPETDLFFKGRSLYGMDKARQSATSAGRFYLVEGYFDVITLHQTGITNAVAPLGTALTSDHVQIVRRLAPSVMLVFDGDAAGVSAALRTLDLFVNSGLDVRVLLLPTGEDPDTFIRKNGVSAFRELEGRAATLLDFAIMSVLNKAQKDSIQDRVKRADEILAILQKTKNPIEKDEYLKVVSERLGVRQDLLRKRLPTLRRQSDASPSSQVQEKPVAKLSIPHGKPEERDLIVLLLQGRLVPDQIRQLDEGAFTVPLYRHILAKALEHLDQEGQVNLEALRGEFSEDSGYESVLSQLSVWDLYIEDVSCHVVGCLRVLENKQIQRLLDELIGQLKVAEREGRHDMVDALNVKINKLQGKKALLTVSP